MGTRSQWKNFLSLTPFILCLFFLITIRLSYANNTREPWQFPYSWILLITVILFLVTTFLSTVLKPSESTKSIWLVNVL